MTQPAMQGFWSDRYGELQFGWGTRLFAEKLGRNVRGKRVLDLGCGAGELSWQLTRAGASVVGVDFVPELLAIANGRTDAGSNMRPRFVEQDVLSLDLGERFDCICGIAILHEIGSEAYPELLKRLKQHLRPDGFCLFMENSYFNALYRLLRRRVVGRAGFRKVGSDDETPFDSGRWRIVSSQFRYATRTCDVFVLFDRMWYQFVHDRLGRVAPSVADACGRACAGADKLISTRVGHNRATLYWSWLQSVYFSERVPRDRALEA